MKSWSEKLDDGVAAYKPSPRSFSDVIKGQRMLVPTARQVDDFIRSIPKGVDMDVRTLRTALAIEHGAETTCPVYTGYQLRTIGEAAWEQLERGAALADITPFWRVLNGNTPTTARLACGAEFVAERRRFEGLTDDARKPAGKAAIPSRRAMGD